MAKKVVVISSSPRKGGNSDTLCDEFIKGAKESGNEVEKIFLKDRNINYCNGCGACNLNDYSGCVQKDDMNEILKKMIDSDVIVFATPVYFYAMSGQMKTFIDRCCGMYTKIIGKDFYYIMTSADTDPECMNRTVEEFRGFLDCLESPAEKGIIRATGFWKKGEINSTKFMQESYNIGSTV